jgi:hypothetical protein
MIERGRAVVAVVFLACLSCAASCGGGATIAADGPEAPPTCSEYCATIQAACVDVNQQYSTVENCMNSCLAFPTGTAGDELDDTLGCRLYHARTAARGPDAPPVHCLHAGPGGHGNCGDDCSGYCDIAMRYCTEANGAAVYDTRAACLSDCAMRGTAVGLIAGSAGATEAGNEVACLLYHAQEASSVPVDHCRGDLALDALSCR